MPPLPRETRLKVIAKTVQETPPNATHWSRPAMAEAVGISPSGVGLYLDPPERAVVLCVDEKSQIQALDRTQPGLPLKKDRAATSCWKHAFGMMIHDY